jgi:phosphopantetheine--protein transferase-like protein
MIFTGIDLVSIKRFEEWQSFSGKKLRRLFLPQEIQYCLAVTNKAASRFAVRFAAKEALFKTISQYDPNHTIPFLTLLASCEIQKTERGIPLFAVDWCHIAPFCTKPVIADIFSISLSLSHDGDYAIAAVILSIA